MMNFGIKILIFHVVLLFNIISFCQETVQMHTVEQFSLPVPTVSDFREKYLPVIKAGLAPWIADIGQYKLQQATIAGSNLTRGELVFLNTRIPKVKTGQEKFLFDNASKINDNQTLKIAFCGSGGGYRAMTCTIGSLIGAQEIGLLDCALYMSGLSGSTWALGSWISSKYDIKNLKNIIANNISKNKSSRIGITAPYYSQSKEIAKNLLIKYVFNQPITSIDIWGALIINNLLGQQNYYMSNQHDVIKSGDWLFPIYTAVEPKGNLAYHWYEFNPYMVGNIQLKTYVPTWSFGRKFSGGKSTDYAPEQTLGYLLGIFGSAYTISPSELIAMTGISKQIDDWLTEKIPLLPEKVRKNAVEEIMKELNNVELMEDIRSQKIQGISVGDVMDITKKLSGSRMSPAEVYNFMYKYQGNNNESALLVDAGIDFNLPFPPLLRSERRIDVIIALDASHPVKDANSLKKAELYARKNGIKFPRIDYTNIGDKAVSIFGTDQKDVPVVIYMPRIKDNSLPGVNDNPLLKNFDPEKCAEKDFCSTFNFAYSVDEFNQLCELTRFNMVSSKDKIKEALQAAFNKKK